MADTPKTYTDAQYADMQAALAARDAQLQADKMAKRTAYQKPVIDLVSTPEFVATLAGLDRLKALPDQDDQLSFQVNALAQIGHQLLDQVSTLPRS